MIQGWIVGDRELVARLEAMPGKLKDGIGRAVLSLAVELQGNVMSGKLSGQVLKVRTGTLRRSITQKVDIGEDSVSGTVGTNVTYAARHEYGFTGTESVKAHLRTITQAFGRPLKEGSKQISVRAFSRKIDYPAHSFLRSALAEMESKIREQLASAVQAAVKA
jgi:HK97 gp10 family phage protein